MTRASDGRGSVFRSADGRWEGYVSVGLDPGSGKRVRRHVRGRTKSEVRHKVDLLITQESRGAVHLDSRTTLSQWLDTWVEERKAVVRPSTISGYRTDLLYVQRAGTGRIALSRLRERDLDELFDWVIATGRNRGTLQHLRRTLNPALGAAVNRGYLAYNPLPHVALRGTSGHVESPYDFEEMGRLLLAARNRRNGARWDLALLGLRQGEVLGLRWADVDFDHAELAISSSLRWQPWEHGCSVASPTSPDGGICGKPARFCSERRGGGPVFAPPKSAAGVRRVGLPDPLVVRLRKHRERQAAERVSAGYGWTEHDCVFATTSGSPIDRTTDREEWLDLVAAAGVRQLRIHDLRHTAATVLLVLGEDSRTIMGVMGWTAHSLVARYAHIVPDLRRRVASKQAALFSGEPTVGHVATAGIEVPTREPWNSAVTLDGGGGDGRQAHRSSRPTDAGRPSTRRKHR